MARSNETENLARMLEILPRLGAGCFSFEELAEKMGCDIDDARRTAAQLADSEGDGGDLGIATFSPEEVQAAIARFGDAARDRLGRLAESGGIALMGGLGPLSAPLRLDEDEGRALLLALDYAGIPDDSPLRQELERCVMPADLDEGRGLRIRIDPTADHRTVRELSLLCRQGRLADIAYASGGAGRAAGGGGLPLRTVAPLELYTGDNGKLYLGAYSYDRGEVRTFSVGRIAAVVPRADHASPEVREMQGRKPFFGDGGPRAVLGVAEGEDFDERVWTGIELEDAGEAGGMRRATLPMARNTAWLSRHIVARLGRVEVLEPESLRGNVAECVHDVLADIKALKAEYRDAPGTVAQ